MAIRVLTYAVSSTVICSYNNFEPEEPVVIRVSSEFADAISGKFGRIALYDEIMKLVRGWRICFDPEDDNKAGLLELLLKIYKDMTMDETVHFKTIVV